MIRTLFLQTKAEFTIRSLIVDLSMDHHWFSYDFRVQPHHTDYSGGVWHGTYIQWMETARVECLRMLGFAFDDFVSAGYDLPVVELQLRYHQPLNLGAAGLVKTRLELTQRIKLNWFYEIYDTTGDSKQLCITGHTLLVPVDINKRKIIRQLPPKLQTMFTALDQYFQASSLDRNTD